jgi:hypothetical protein
MTTSPINPKDPPQPARIEEEPSSREEGVRVSQPKDSMAKAEKTASLSDYMERVQAVKRTFRDDLYRKEVADTHIDKQMAIAFMEAALSKSTELFVLRQTVVHQWTIWATSAEGASAVEKSFMAYSEQIQKLSKEYENALQEYNRTVPPTAESREKICNAYVTFNKQSLEANKLINTEIAKYNAIVEQVNKESSKMIPDQKPYPYLPIISIPGQGGGSMVTLPTGANYDYSAITHQLNKMEMLFSHQRNYDLTIARLNGRLEQGYNEAMALIQAGFQTQPPTAESVAKMNAGVDLYNLTMQSLTKARNNFAFQYYMGIDSSTFGSLNIAFIPNLIPPAPIARYTLETVVKMAGISGFPLERFQGLTSRVGEPTTPTMQYITPQMTFNDKLPPPPSKDAFLEKYYQPAAAVLEAALKEIQRQATKEPTFEELFQKKGQYGARYDITLPEGFAMATHPEFLNISMDIGQNQTEICGLGQGVNVPFLQRILGQTLFKGIIPKELANREEISRELQQITGVLVSHVAQKTGAFLSQDPAMERLSHEAYEVQEMLAFGRALGDMVQSSEIKDHLEVFMSSHPELAALPEGQKERLLSSLSSAVRLSLVQIGMEQVAEALDSSDAMTTGIIEERSEKSDDLRLENPLSLLFLKDHLFQFALGDPRNRSREELGKMVNVAINQTVIGMPFGSREDLRGTLMENFEEQGFGEQTEPLAEAALAFMDHEREHPLLDRSFHPLRLSVLASVLPKETVNALMAAEDSTTETAFVPGAYYHKWAAELRAEIEQDPEIAQGIVAALQPVPKSNRQFHLQLMQALAGRVVDQADAKRIFGLFYGLLTPPQQNRPPLRMGSSSEFIEGLSKRLESHVSPEEAQQLAQEAVALWAGVGGLSALRDGQMETLRHLGHGSAVEKLNPSARQQDVPHLFEHFFEQWIGNQIAVGATQRRPTDKMELRGTTLGEGSYHLKLDIRI